MLRNKSNKTMESQLDNFIEQALQEDAPKGDITSAACIDPSLQSQAQLRVKDAGIIAGVEVARLVIAKVDPLAEFHQLLQDGSHCSYGDIAFVTHCNTRALLRAERVLLNVMQRMSGIATQASHFAFEVEDLPVKILDTRKTTPLVRFLEKWAVRLGGCHNYRESLSDWFMIKDNHIKACGGVSQAILKVWQYKAEQGIDLGVTVEVKNLVELHEVLETGHVNRIMFDNFELPLLAEAVQTVNGRFETEASGGVNIHNVRKVALSGVDFISVGALTHSAQSLDLSLKVI